MAWSDWSAFDTAALVGGALGEQLEKSANHFRRVASELQGQSLTSEMRAARMLAARREFESLNQSALKDLDGWERDRIDAKLVGSLDSIKAELGKAQAFLRSADESLAIERNVAALGRNLGCIVGAADLLVKLRNPNLNNYEFTEAGIGFVGGVIGGSLGFLG